MIERECLFGESDIFRHRRRSAGIDLSQQVVGQNLAEIRDRIGDRTIDNMARYIGADARVVVGLEHAAEGFHGLQRRFEDIVGEKGDTITERIHGDQHGPKIKRARGKLAVADQEIGERHPHFERQVFIASAEKCLGRVDMRVDEARRH